MIDLIQKVRATKNLQSKLVEIYDVLLDLLLMAEYDNCNKILEAVAETSIDENFNEDCLLACLMSTVTTEPLLPAYKDVYELTKKEFETKFGKEQMEEVLRGLEPVYFILNDKDI